MTDTEQLKKKIGILKQKVTKFSNRLIHFETVGSITELQLRLTKIEEIWDGFDQLQTELEELDPSQASSRESFEDNYFSVVAKARIIIDSVAQPSPTSNNSSQSNPQPTLPNITPSLPVINVPIFAGSYEGWISFFQIYESVIHNRTDLSKIQKFYYLKSYLKGDASQLLHSLELTDDNYDVAINLLKERYENKKMLIHNHMKNIVDLPPINKESYVALRKCIDIIQRNVRSLKTLGESVDTWDTILIFLIVSKLDSQSRKEWEMFSNKISQPKLEDLLNCLKNKCQLLETLDSKTSNKEKENNQFSVKSYSGDKTRVHLATSDAQSQNQNTSYRKQNNVYKYNCTFCKQNTHITFKCRKLLSLPIISRYSELNKAGICTNCLQIGHSVEVCTGRNCRICNKRHNTMLHDEDRNSSVNSENATSNNLAIVDSVSNKQSIADNEAAVSLTFSSTSQNNQILLATALIKIKCKDNTFVQCRALLDSASQSNFCTQELFDILKISGKRIDIPISGINNQNACNVKLQIETEIKAVNGSYVTTLPLLIVDQITSNLPQYPVDISCLNIPLNIKLADENFNTSQKIDILLGTQLFYDILCDGQIRLGNNLPVLQNSKCGWILAGPIPIIRPPSSVPNRENNCFFTTNAALHNQLEKFWQLENINNSHVKLSNEELECEDHFRKNLHQKPDGRYIVKMPLKKSHADLGESLSTAVKRLIGVEKRLSKSPELKLQYSDFLREYENLGHMTRISPNEVSNSGINYYIPHHAVFKENSSTSKIRVVFDASCATSTGLSLNDVTKLGPKVQSDLFDILLRMRIHTVVITADIEKMYRMIEMHEADRPLQRIVWRENSLDEIIHFQLNTVTYGVKSSSFLATRVLNEIGLKCKSFDINLSKIIIEDFYMDDLITGASNTIDAINLKSNLSKILSESGFNLRKWMSNDPNVIKPDSSDIKVDSMFHIKSSEEPKTLGVLWEPRSDTLRYAFNFCVSAEFVTKRTVLSGLAQLFDPLGLISPCVVKAKLIMQRIWKLQTDWDSYLPDEIKQNWLNFVKNIPFLNELEINRHIFLPNSLTIHLHGFCDASMSAYGACIYALSEDSFGNRKSTLICAKSRLAPLKTQSLPRLELSSALLLAELMAKVSVILRNPINSITYWTDSMIVLSWLNAEPNKWKIFVSNRVAEIQRLSENSIWRHIDSANNPADIVSRGVDPLELKNYSQWWQGPHFLIENKNTWPETQIINIPDIPEARKENIVLSFSLLNDLGIFKRYSCYNKLLHVTAYILRYLFNCRNKSNKRLGPLCSFEIDNAVSLLCGITQHQAFSVELKCLKYDKPIPRHSKLISLNPFIDADGILRVGGRLYNSNLSFEHKYPIVLPAKHIFVRLLIEHFHRKYLHASSQFLLSQIRKEYWPLNAKNEIRSVLRKCLICFKVKPLGINQQMGSLPEARVVPSCPFTCTGIDFAGPYLIKESKLRSRTLIKMYLCVFVCMSTKAVHFEIASDLTCHAFLNVFKRFTSRRGVPSHLYSDNAKNFVGTDNIWKNFYKSLSDGLADNTYGNFFLENRIKWHFIPARSPHHGGIWESAIKSFKSYFKRVIGNTVLNFEEFLTITVQIEAILNSRPLTPLSNDPKDIQALTPGHFLIGRHLLSSPQNDVTEIPCNRLKKYHQLQQLVQRFWKLWRESYLHTLQQRNKWTTKFENIKLDTLVLLQDDNLAPLYWSMGRVIALHPGPDNLVRVVSIQTRNGIVKRSVQKICPLPIEDHHHLHDLP